MDAITDKVLVVRAADSCGGNAYNFATIRVIPQTKRVNFLLVYVEGDYLVANQSLSTRLGLVQKLAGFGRSSTPSPLYVAGFREGTIGVLYTNLSISDFDCESFRKWSIDVYTGGNYTQQFANAIFPFVAAAKGASLVGPCATPSFNITPLLGSKFANISSLPTSETASLLETIVPLVVVVFLLITAGIAACFLYRYNRSERKHLHDSRSTYTDRQPVYLDGELSLPTRRRRPAFIQGEGEHVPMVRGSNHLSEEVDFSNEDDELVNPDILVSRQHVWQRTGTSPPYRLPPICEDRTEQLARDSELLEVEDGANVEMELGSEEEDNRHSPPKYRLPECARLL